MSGQNERGRRAPSINVGAASIVMVFAVLCLTIFAVLSLVTARGEMELARKSADAVSAYYAADSAACEIYDNIAMGIYDEGELMPDGSIAYSVPIDERQQLSVILELTGYSPRIIQWKVVDTGLWEPDEGVDVWQGN